MILKHKVTCERQKTCFESALDKTGFGLYNHLHTCLTGLITISFTCITYGTTIIVPISACELETTGPQQGMLASAPVIGAVLGATLWGYLGDTRGRKNMLLTSLLVSGTINAFASLSVNWIMLMVLQFIASFLASGEYTLSMTLLSESVPTAKRNMVVLFVTSICVMAQGFMAVLAMPINPLTFSYYIPFLGIYWNSWRTVLLVFSLPSFVCAIWLYYTIQESPKFVFMKQEEDKALEILKAIYRVNMGKSAEEFQVKGLLLESSEKTKGGCTFKSQIVPLFKPPLLRNTVIMTTLSVFLQVGPFLVWLPTIANHFFTMMETGQDQDVTLCSIIRASLDSPSIEEGNPCALNEAALWTIFVGCLMRSIMNGLLTFAVARAGRRNTVMAVTAVIGACGILVNLIHNAIGSAVLFILYSMGVVTLGMYTAMTVALFPTHLRAMAVSLTMTGGRLTGFASIQILNYLLSTNCELGFYLFASIFASSAIVASFLPDDRFQKLEVQQKETDQEMQRESS